jgi:hypothetical protein
LDFGSENVTSILLVLDTANEQKIGLAPHFNPYILAKNEVMLLKSAMDFFDFNVGDNITIYFDLSYNSTVANSSTPDINPLQQAFHFVSLAVGLEIPHQVHHMLGASTSDPDI